MVRNKIKPKIIKTRNEFLNIGAHHVDRANIIQVCAMCRHTPCPYCKTWCDVLLWREVKQGEEGYINPKDKVKRIINWPVLCCGWKCDKMENMALKKRKNL